LVKPFDRIQCVFGVDLPFGKNEKFLCANVNVGLFSNSLHCNALFSSSLVSGFWGALPPKPPSMGLQLEKSWLRPWYA